MKTQHYSKEMRARAKADDKELMAVDVHGFQLQTPISTKHAKQLLALVSKWYTKVQKEGG